MNFQTALLGVRRMSEATRPWVAGGMSAIGLMANAGGTVARAIGRWEERSPVSIVNPTRQDGIEFLRLAPEIGIVTSTARHPLAQANQAPADLRAGRFEGAAVPGP